MQLCLPTHEAFTQAVAFGLVHLPFFNAPHTPVGEPQSAKATAAIVALVELHARTTAS